MFVVVISIVMTVIPRYLVARYPLPRTRFLGTLSKSTYEVTDEVKIQHMLNQLVIY